VNRSEVNGKQQAVNAEQDKVNRHRLRFGTAGKD
jgi:hypothetical protein